MGARSGLAAQLMMGEESTWGTAVTPTKAYKFVDLVVAQEIARIESEGIQADVRVDRSDDWVPGTRKVAGDVVLELSSKNWAFLFGHMFGGTATTSGSGPFSRTYTPGDLTGKGLTVQGGIPDVSGTVNPFTWSGCKIASWQLSSEVGKLARVTLSLVGKDETTATALAVAGYTSGNKLFSFVHGSLTFGGTSTKVRTISLKGDNGLDVERFFNGQDTIDEPFEVKRRLYTGSFEADFTNLTAYNRYVNGTEAALVLTFARGTDTVTYTLNVRVDGKTPEVKGTGIVPQPMDFKAVGPTTDASAITAVVVSSEATP